MTTQHIIAMGGGGFSQDAASLRLDRYILGHARKSSPAVCFVPTASGEAQGYIEAFHAAYGTLDCRPRHLSLFHPPTADMESYVLECDVVYVGGGNTFNMLTLWRAWGLDAIMRRALKEGIVLCGLSAGSICWFEQGVTDSFMPEGSQTLSAMDCLGFLAGSNCPHYDGEAYRRPEFHRLLRAGQIGDGWAADDYVGLHFVDGQLHVAVSSRPGAQAYRLNVDAGEVTETPLAPTLLGNAGEH